MGCVRVLLLRFSTKILKGHAAAMDLHRTSKDIHSVPIFGT